MPQSSNKDVEIIQQTGDAFVDLGSLVLQTLISQFPEKNLFELIELVTDVYISKWQQKLHSIFHTNSKILNPSTKGKHQENTINYFTAVVKNKNIEDSILGFCRTCGRKGILYKNSREFFPICGSGKFVNFHHSHESGIYLCNECTLNLFFVPLGVIALGNMVCFLQHQSIIVKEYWIKKIIFDNLDKLSRNSSQGILRTNLRNPKNALFQFASDIILDLKNENQSEFLQLICFSNFGAAPDCSFYVLPNPVFNFLNKILLFYRLRWFKFVRRHYRISGAKWDELKSVWTKKDKDTIQILSNGDYVNNSNLIYERLLSNQSILKQLLSSYKTNYNKNLEKFPLEITIHYIREVLDMEKEQIKIIQRISDVIFELSKRENNFKKYLILLESAGKAFQLRGALIKIIKANYKSGAKEPLVRLAEYVNYLFPDGQFWGEVRDLILIHLYEKLHDEGIQTEDIPETIPIDTEDEPVNIM